MVEPVKPAVEELADILKLVNTLYSAFEKSEVEAFEVCLDLFRHVSWCLYARRSSISYKERCPECGKPLEEG